MLWQQAPGPHKQEAAHEVTSRWGTNRDEKTGARMTAGADTLDAVLANKGSSVWVDTFTLRFDIIRFNQQIINNLSFDN